MEWDGPAHTTISSPQALQQHRKGRIPAWQAPREPHPYAETHALSLKRETETVREMRENQASGQKKIDPRQNGPSQPPPPLLL